MEGRCLLKVPLGEGGLASVGGWGQDAGAIKSIDSIALVVGMQGYKLKS